jgi:hypothetical protein
MQSIAAWPCISRSGFAPRSPYPGCGTRGNHEGADFDPDQGGGRLDPGRTLPRDGGTSRPDGAPIALTFNREPRRRAVATRYQLPQPLARMQSAGGQRRGKKRCTPSPPLIWAGHPPRADRQVRKARLCSKVSCRALGPDTVHGEIPVVDDVEIRRTSSTMAHHSRLK